MIVPAVLLSLNLLGLRDVAYVGRFYLAPEQARCQWSGSTVRARVNGPKFVFACSDSAGGHDRIEVVIDGSENTCIEVREAAREYTVQLGEGPHTVELVKRTEAWVGTITYTSFNAPDGHLLKPEPKRRHIEIVGDSITCGYGNLGENENVHFEFDTENANLAYGVLAARALNADWTLLAWSGKKMWPDNTLPELYEEVLPAQPGTAKYDFQGPAPDAVVVNLGTNDFNPKDPNPEEAGWTGAYESLIRRIWAHYPKARVYAAIGPMMNDEYPPGRKALTTIRAYLQHLISRVNDPRLGLIEFPMQNKDVDGLGADWHPSLKTHRKMGAILADVLAKDLGWTEARS